MVNLGIGIVLILLSSFSYSSAQRRNVTAIFIRTADGLAGVQAVVTLGGRIEMTNRDGKVQFIDLPKGSYELQVSPEPPYKSFRWVVQVPVKASIVFKLDKP